MDAFVLQDELKQALASRDALKKQLRHLQSECHSTCSLSDYAMRNNSNLYPSNASVPVPEQQRDSMTVSASAVVPNNDGHNDGAACSSNPGPELHHAHVSLFCCLSVSANRCVLHCAQDSCVVHQKHPLHHAINIVVMDLFDSTLNALPCLVN